VQVLGVPLALDPRPAALKVALLFTRRGAATAERFAIADDPLNLIRVTPA
jgi:hypothetical protein